MNKYDVIVLGAGAAGLMCAAVAGHAGRRVLLLDAASRPGNKILISGGGRCNFTNVRTEPENFLSANPHFARSALARYTPADFLALVDRYRIPWHEKKLGQLFCDRSAQDIVDLLVAECRDAGVVSRYGCGINEVRRTTEFVLETNQGSISAPALVVATGGLSIPKMGATGFGYDLARQFGLAVVPTRPALVPLVLAPADRARWCDLAGVAAESRVCFGRHSFEERILVTHRGLSGPAILQISSYWDGRKPVTIDLLPGKHLSAPGNREWKTVLAEHVPKRLAERWIEINHSGPGVHRQEEVEARLHEWQLLPSGTEGYEKAEVTAGGVDTAELSSKTMEAKKVPGLYFVGEAIDVTGHLGGYNFQWAWASGYAAGTAI